MGQKTHPKGFRVGIIEPWESTWFAKKKDYPEFVAEDKKIRIKFKYEDEYNYLMEFIKERKKFIS